ncbi:MAG: DUF29 domain-containing protein [Crocosphaera sp.]
MKVSNHQATEILYEQDYNLWLETTIKKLRLREFSEIDLDNLIEELESMGRSDKRALKSLLTRLFEHLLKIAYWESEREYNYRGWNGEIQNFRIQIKRLLKDSPSLKVYLVDNFEESYQDARKITIKKTGLDYTIFPNEPIANLEQILDDNWLPNISK